MNNYEAKIVAFPDVEVPSPNYSFFGPIFTQNSDSKNRSDFKPWCLSDFQEVSPWEIKNSKKKMRFY